MAIYGTIFLVGILEYAESGLGGVDGNAVTVS